MQRSWTKSFELYLESKQLPPRTLAAGQASPPLKATESQSEITVANTAGMAGKGTKETASGEGVYFS